MHPAAFEQQRRIGEELLAAGWHASAIAVAAKPASAWVLNDASRRVRVRMSADLSACMAEVTAAKVPDGLDGAPLWRLRIHHAPAPSIIAAILAAPDAADSGWGRATFRIARALSDAGLLADRGFFTAAFSGHRSWRSPGRAAEATWSLPSRRQAGGWQIHTGSAHLDASCSTPAAVLVPLIGASATSEPEARA